MGVAVVVCVNLCVGIRVTGDTVEVSSEVVFVGVGGKLEQACMIRTKRLMMIFTCFLSIFPPEMPKSCFLINLLLNERQSKYTAKNNHFMAPKNRNTYRVK
jgi:hypothetical protein